MAENPLERRLIISKNHIESFPPPGKKITIVFVIGGPGSGKGTQCAKIVKQFGFTHLSAGDLLREEAKYDTEQGTMIKNLMNEGKLVSSDLIVKLLFKAMRESGNDKFLVDGFPRNEENRHAYENIIHIEPEFLLFIDCSKEEMERRILNRNQGRDDDNIDTIRRRFDVFQQQTLPVIQYYEKRGELRKVDGNRQVDEVFEDVKAIFAQLNNQKNHDGEQAGGLSRAQMNPLKRWFFDFLCGCFGTKEARN
uniref:UMP-CMP kinase n=1 Tax=Oryza meridionalis TaxID=40149 RepID=A0A0E0DVN3_9ORYZ